MINNPIPYSYLSSMSNKELCEIEELCIANQDILTLKRIETIKAWRATDKIVRREKRNGVSDYWDQQFCR